MRAHSVFNHAKGRRAGIRDFYKHLNKNAQVVYNLLSDIELGVEDIENIDVLYRGYLSIFVEDYYSFNEPYTINGQRGSHAMHLFLELSRIHFLLQYQRLKDEKQQVLYDVTMKDSYDTMLTFSFDSCRSEFWTNNSQLEFHSKTIMTYGQTHVIDALLYINKRMEEMPYDKETFEDFDMLTLSLFTRNSIFLCEACSDQAFDHLNMRKEVPNVESKFTFNNDYLMLCTIYFNSIQRRLYYWKQFETLHQDIPRGMPTEVCETWFSTEVIPSLGDEGFDDLFAKASESSYDFVGDREWFVYRYPQRVIAKGPVLDCIRPVEAQQYFKGIRYSKDVTLELSRGHRNDINGKMARRFFLLAIDQYFRNNHSVGWYEAVVIENEQLEKEELKICKSPFPCLLKLLGDYWVYHDGVVYPSSNIYTTFAMWLYLIHKKYNNWFVRVNLKYLVKVLFKK